MLINVLLEQYKWLFIIKISNQENLNTAEVIILIFNLFLDLVYYVSAEEKSSNIELGSIDYPFKSLDDPFREIIN